MKKDPSVTMGVCAFLAYNYLTHLNKSFSGYQLSVLNLFSTKIYKLITTKSLNHESFPGVKDEQLLDAVFYLYGKQFDNKKLIDDNIIRSHIKSIQYLMNYIDLIFIQYLKILNHICKPHYR